MGSYTALNTYRHAAAIALHRLRWDLRRESWRSRRKLASLKNTHAGEKAIILCNGPSLNTVDFEAIRGIYTFGLNKINLLFDKKNFRPSSIVSVNPHVISQNADFFNSTTIPLFLNHGALSNIKTSPSRVFLHSSVVPSFSQDCRYSVYEGFTVTYVAMQLAFHMGFQKVALLGCDHYFGDIEAPNKAEKKVGPDLWHFDQDYFADGTIWDTPDLLQSECSYNMALLNYQENGRMLVNSTTESHLSILPRIDIQEFLALD